jgi:hypothetical protein
VEEVEEEEAMRMIKMQIRHLEEEVVVVIDWSM